MTRHWRRGPGSPRSARTGLRWGWVASMGGALALVGFVGYAQWNGSLARVQFTTSVQQAGAHAVLGLEQEQTELRAQIEAAEAEVQRFQESSTTSSAALAQLNEQLAAARLAAGLTRMRGPGGVIEIADSNRIVPGGGDPAHPLRLGGGRKR